MSLIFRTFIYRCVSSNLNGCSSLLKAKANVKILTSKSSFENTQNHQLFGNFIRWWSSISKPYQSRPKCKIIRKLKYGLQSPARTFSQKFKVKAKIDLTGTKDYKLMS